MQDYTHSTAPNRRFPDLVAQRILKAGFAAAAQPYSEDDLNAIAARCTQMEDQARKVEREMQKRIAAVVLHPRIGQTFHAIVTGVKQLRHLRPHPRSARGWQAGARRRGLDVGDRLNVRLIGTDPARGFIDFVAVGVGTPAPLQPMPDPPPQESLRQAKDEAPQGAPIEYAPGSGRIISLAWKDKRIVFEDSTVSAARDVPAWMSPMDAAFGIVNKAR